MTENAQTGLWDASLVEEARTVPLAADLSVDLVIVGGGFTGCAAALEAAGLGASVALLEAHSIGHGGSGRNAGLVNAGLWLPPETIIDQMGEAAGRRLIEALADAPDRVFDLIDREEIACEATRTGTLHLAHAPGGMDDLKLRHRQGNAFGASLQLLDAAEARRRTGSDAFHGALWNPRAGTIQPLGYCHGLARAAINGGAQVFSDTPVEAIERRNDTWSVRANGHTVTAGALLVATNAYAEAGAKPPAPQYVPVHYSQFATEPLPANRARHHPAGQGGLLGHRHGHVVVPAGCRRAPDCRRHGQ